MKTSIHGVEFIKSFEGCRLVAYKAVPTEKYYTIGYGHYGADVKSGMKISQSEADALLVQDLVKFEQAVDKYNNKYRFNQNQFDALVSFTYNCGVGNLTKLLLAGARPLKEIPNKMLSYNKSSGKVLKGLTRRRQAEKNLFDTPSSRFTLDGVNYSYVFEPEYYYNHNPDLKVLGRDNKLLFEHFIVFGMKEGRQAIGSFNVKKYLEYSENEDVKTMATEKIKDSKTGKNKEVINYVKAYQHYCIFGHNEKHRRTV